MEEVDNVSLKEYLMGCFMDKGKGGFPFCEVNFSQLYLETEKYLNEKLHSQVVSGAAANGSGYLTEHGPRHVGMVIQRASLLLGKNISRLSGYETFLLLLAIHFHDVGKAFSIVVDEIIEKRVKNVLVDVSTFTHEHLLILLRILFDKQDEFQSVVAVYSHPGEYSPDRNDEEKWLSKGCREVRSVFGYPGMMIPGSPTALILLAGFEVSRACAVVSEMDPAILYIGKGVADDREKMIHQKPMEGFAKMVREFCATRDSVSEFDFFAKDMEKTEDCINKILDAVPKGSNRVIVPMNSKISTIACARIAITHPDVQLCYAQPEAYNVTSYSTVGNRITLLNLFSKLPVGKITGLEALAL